MKILDSKGYPAPRRSRRGRWVMLAWLLAVLGWLGYREMRAHAAIRVATELEGLFQNEPRFAAVRVILSTGAELSILAPDDLVDADRADLGRLVAAHAGGAKNRILYEAAAAPKLPPAKPLAGDKFLGLRDDESRKIKETAPESAVGGVTELTDVSTKDYADYQTALAKGDVKDHATRDGYVYYSRVVGRDVPFPNGTSAWVFVTERYKAKLPGK